MENFKAIILSVFSGILTFVLLWICSVFYKKVFLPWIETILYRGILIGGRWSSYHKHNIDNEYEMNLDIRQTAYNVEGEFFAKSIHPQSKISDINYYKFKGEIINDYLVVNYKITSREKMGLGAFVLKIDEGGEILKGNIAYVNESNMSITTLSNVKFKRP